jgi:CubicO group peptidase (beta-lactamase class C family)
MKISMNRRTLLAGTAAAGGLLTMPALGASTTPGGYSPEGLKNLTSTLKPFVDAGEAVGLVTLLYRRGEIAQVDALGWQDRDAKTPMARDSIFRIMSMTKPITSVATLMLMEEGKLRLNDPVMRWLPELSNPKVLRAETGPVDDLQPASRPITVLDLLTHRAGLAYGFTATGPISKLINEKLFGPAAADFTGDQWIKALGSIPLVNDVGAQWRYSVATDVLGLLIERVSGTSFPEFLRTRILEPLGMVDTAFFVPKEKAARVAVLYGYGPGGKRVASPIRVRTAPPKFASGGGGLYSTADDYLKFARMMLGGGKLGDVRLVSRQSIALMTTNWLTADQRKVPFAGMDYWGGQGFGLGVAVVDDIARYSALGTASAGSYYWPGAYGTWWLADPKEDMILIYMVQNDTSFRTRTPEQTAAQRELQAQSSVAAFQTMAYRAIED